MVNMCTLSITVYIIIVILILYLLASYNAILCGNSTVKMALTKEYIQIEIANKAKISNEHYTKFDIS